MASARTRVYIVDDLPSMRARLAELLHEIDGVEIVGEAGDPESAIAGILDQRPQFVLLDYQLEGGTALDVLRAAHAQVPDTSSSCSRITHRRRIVARAPKPARSIFSTSRRSSAGSVA